MTKFIKLTNRIINTAYIKNIYAVVPNSINKLDSKNFQISMASSNFFGFTVAGTGFFNGGSNLDTIIISADKEPEDYKIIEEWINKI